MAILITQYPGRRMKLFVKRSAALAAVESNVYFAGRLAQYRYYHMD
jgi:UDP-galactopyranose mutase